MLYYTYFPFAERRRTHRMYAKNRERESQVSEDGKWKKEPPKSGGERGRLKKRKVRFGVTWRRR